MTSNITKAVRAAAGTTLCRNIRRGTLAALALAGIMASAQASAGQIFTDRASFLAALGGAGTTTTFDSITTDVPLSGVPTTSLGYTFTSPGFGSSIDAAPFRLSAASSVNGTSYFYTGNFQNGSTITIQMPSAAAAFGFDMAAFAPSGVQQSEVFVGSTSLGKTPAATGTVGFLGYIADPGSSFSLVTIISRSTVQGSFVGFDNFTTAAASAAAVPEPATWAMMLVGFGVVGGALRRRVTGVSYQTA